MNSPSPRRAFSLLELLAVIVILGVMTGVGISLRPQLWNMTGVECDSRRLLFDLAQARRRAISTGDSHFLQFQAGSGGFTGYTVCRRAGGGAITPVDDFHAFPSGATITRSSDPEFNFEGAALTATTMTLAMGGRTWTLQVIPATGAITVTDP